MTPLISIIIPIYNVEEYLGQCLESVVNQTYGNLEIICVNDCSTDSSHKILEEYAHKDSRIIILKNEKNLGLGLSRNEGIEAAKGEFIHCLDSDDWLEPNAYESLIKYLDKDVDAVRFQFTSHDCNTGKKQSVPYPEGIILGEKINFYKYPKLFNMWSSSAWLKIYRKDFLTDNNLYYNDYRCLEDIEYAMRVAIKAQNVIFIPDILLNYRFGRKNSLLTKRVYYVDNLAKDAQWANENTKELPEELRNVILDYIYKHLFMNALDSYCLNILKFEDMQRMFKQHINLELLQLPYAQKIIKNVLNYNEYQFFCSYCIQRFLKSNAPILTRKYLELKKKLLNPQ